MDKRKKNIFAQIVLLVGYLIYHHFIDKPVSEIPYRRRCSGW
jgi:hypothetical protein